MYALAGAVDPVLGLDRPGMLDDAYTLREIEPGQDYVIGPFEVETLPLPHSVPNVGLRVRAGPHVLAYTGDTGPSPHLLPLAREADVFLAEATYPSRYRQTRSATSRAPCKLARSRRSHLFDTLSSRTCTLDRPA